MSDFVRRACIDIGSNTTRLLVADCDCDQVREVHQVRDFTLLGHGLRVSGRIPDEKIAEVAGVVASQVTLARKLGVTQIHAVATAAIRRAANGHELVRAISEASGIDVTVLSGEEEARLAFIGAARTLDHIPPGPLGVVDVGGGSVEFAVGEVPDTVGWWTSLAVGSADLAEAFFHSDPPDEHELAAARSRLAGMLAGVQIPCAVEAVAIGGSATSLSRLAGQLLDATAFERALRVVTSRRATEIADWLSLDRERVRLMPAGLLILEAASKRFGLALTVGRGGIREGVLLGGLSL